MGVKIKIYIPLAILLIAAMFIYSSKLYYPPAPIESVSKKELVEKGNTAVNELVYVTEENNINWYIISMNSSMTAAEIIQQEVADSGWHFVLQEGSGLFFEQNGEGLIITTEMWSKRFKLVKVPADAWNHTATNQ